MTSKEILIAYKAGRLSKREAREKLHVVREQLKSIEEEKTKADITHPAEIPLSYSQERLWFLAQLGNNEQYNISRAVKIKGRLDEDALQKAMTFIARRHESLRTGFKPLNGAAIQVMEAAADLQVEKRDLSGFSEKEREREPCYHSECEPQTL